MENNKIYDHIIESLDKYEKKIRHSVGAHKENRTGWVELAKNFESHFQDTKFFLYGIRKYQDAHIGEKYQFLNLYNSIVSIGLETGKDYFRKRSAIEQGIEFLTSGSEIYGPALITSNCAQISFPAEPDFDSKKIITNHIYEIQPHEYKSIIEAWYIMWLEQKISWGEQFDEKYFAHEVLEDKGQIKFLNPIKEQVAYKRFWNTRESLIDSWVSTGRLKSKKPSEYAR